MDDRLRNSIMGHALATEFCESAGLFAFGVVSQADPGGGVISYGGWMGEVPVGVDSKAPQVAYRKTGELVMAGAGLDGQLVMTPIEGNELSDKWMGGVALNGTIVAVSKWAQEHDRLLALAVLYHAQYGGLELHHAGFRFLSEKSWQVANAGLEGGMIRPAEDHQRMYFTTGKGYYLEHQWFPGGPHDQAMHWDVVCDDPQGLLRFVSSAYGKEPKFFEDCGSHDPIGVFWVTSGDGTKIGLMARPIWWDV